MILKSRFKWKCIRPPPTVGTVYRVPTRALCVLRLLRQCGEVLPAYLGVLSVNSQRKSSIHSIIRSLI
jgi:hypothetical protein